MQTEILFHEFLYKTQNGVEIVERVTGKKEAIRRGSNGGGRAEVSTDQK